MQKYFGWQKVIRILNFFMHVTSTRRRVNHIPYLVNDAGDIVDVQAGYVRNSKIIL